MTKTIKLNLSQTILVAFLVPFLGALVAFGVWIAQLQAIQTEEHRTEEVLALATEFDHLMELTTLERDLSLAFRAGAGVERQALVGARAAVDKEARLIQSMQPADFPDVSEQLLAVAKSMVLTAIKDLGAIRQAVDRNEPNARVFDVYSDVNQAILGTIRYVGRGFSDPDIRPLFELEVLVFEWVEQLSQMRGQLAVAFAEGAVDPYRFSALQSIEGGPAWIARLEHYVGAELRDELNGLQQQTGWRNAERLKAAFFASEDLGRIQAQPGWFDAASAQIQVVHGLLDAIDHQIHALAEAKITQASQTRFMVLTGLAIFTVLALLFIVSVRRNLVRRVGALRDLVGQAAQQRDLTGRINDSAHDELGTIAGSLDHYLESMCDALKDINQQVSVTEEQLSIINQSAEGAVINAGTQHEQTDQIATAMAEMNQTSEEIARNIQECSSEIGSIGEKGRENRTLIMEAHQSMQRLDREFDSTSQVISQLADDAQAISGILESIESIAEQTNLLALNAAIEAARAGEQGRGFAVVADEVRSLAKRTQDSIEEVGTIIERLNASSESAVRSMTRSKQTTNETEEVVNRSQAMFESLFNQIEKVEGFMAQVATAVEEQTQVSESINQNIQAVSSLSDKTLEDIEKAGNAVDSMVTCFNQMKTRIDAFKIQAS